jgi:hypothetical protein
LLDRLDEILQIQQKTKRDKKGMLVCDLKDPTLSGAFTYEESNFMEEAAEVEEHITVPKPWVGVIKPPSDFTKELPNSSAAPNLNLALEHVYGYRVK